ncbi:hypothetical protein, partial [uncultured Muribaculum sp.]
MHLLPTEFPPFRETYFRELRLTRLQVERSSVCAIISGCDSHFSQQSIEDVDIPYLVTVIVGRCAGQPFNGICLQLQ